jgi:hypothetical protein
MVLVFSLSIGFSAGRENQEEAPNVFVHSSISIVPEQVIGRLMVACGDASIAGKVTDGIIINVEGESANLILFSVIIGWEGRFCLNIFLKF